MNSATRVGAILLGCSFLVGSLCRALSHCQNRQRALPSGHSCGDSIRTCGRLAESLSKMGGRLACSIVLLHSKCRCRGGSPRPFVDNLADDSPTFDTPTLALSSSSFFPCPGLATREGKSTLQGLVFQPSQGKNDSRSYLLTTASPCCCCLVSVVFDGSFPLCVHVYSRTVVPAYRQRSSYLCQTVSFSSSLHISLPPLSPFNPFLISYFLFFLFSLSPIPSSRLRLCICCSSLFRPPGTKSPG